MGHYPSVYFLNIRESYAVLSRITIVGVIDHPLACNKEMHDKIDIFFVTLGFLKEHLEYFPVDLTGFIFIAYAILKFSISSN